MTVLALPLPFQLSAAVGWDGWIRPGRWHPVTLTVRSDRAVEGWIVLELTQGPEGRVRYRRPVQLSEGATALLRMAVPLRDVRSPPVLTLEAEGKVLASVAAATSPRRASASLIGVLDRERRGFPLSPDQAAAFLDEGDLPEDAVAYTSLDFLVIRSLDERELNERQHAALRAWVTHGGRVLVADGFEPTGPLGSWLVSGRTGLGAVKRWRPSTPLRPPRAPEADPLQVVTPSPPRAPFGRAAAGLAGAWLLLLAALRVAGSGRNRWIALPIGAALATAGLVRLAGDLRERVTLPNRQQVTVVAEGIAWTHGSSSQISAYGGPVAYRLPSRSSVALRGEFTDAEVRQMPEGTWVLAAAQQPGRPLGVRWERVDRTTLGAALDPQGRWLLLEGGTLSSSWLLWRGQMRGFERLLPGRTFLDPARWRAADPDHPGVRAWRQVDPASDDIMRDHPVVLAEAGDHWIVLVVQRR